MNAASVGLKCTSTWSFSLSSTKKLTAPPWDDKGSAFDLVATTTNKYKCSRSEKPISKDIDNPEMMDFGELEMGFQHE
jgi:hypothetical protein